LQSGKQKVIKYKLIGFGFALLRTILNLDGTINHEKFQIALKKPRKLS
jgi:hypothetical protein